MSMGRPITGPTIEAEAKMKEAERVAERDHASTVAAARAPETAKRGVASIRSRIARILRRA